MIRILESIQKWFSQFGCTDVKNLGIVFFVPLSSGGGITKVLRGGGGGVITGAKWGVSVADPDLERIVSPWILL